MWVLLIVGQKMAKLVINGMFKAKFKKAFLIKSWSPSPIFFKDKKIGKIRSILHTEK